MLWRGLWTVVLPKTEDYGYSTLSKAPEDKLKMGENQLFLWKEMNEACESEDGVSKTNYGDMK
jgi:hypothetical protein